MSVEHSDRPAQLRRRIAIIGGGPGGLFAAISIAHLLPGAQVDVYEQNAATDVFGFGVVFSDATLENIDEVDTVLRDALADDGRRWDTIEVHTRGEVIAAAGNGMSAIHRRVLLIALQKRAAELGTRLHFTSRADVDTLDASKDYDLIIAADGANSATRQRFLGDLGHVVDDAAVKFIWFGTTYDFNGLTFLHKESDHGNFAVHAYPIGSGLSTFIVETDADTWRRAGLDAFDTSAAPGLSDERSQRYLEDLFAAEIDSHPLVANNSRWANFRTRRTERWHTVAPHGTPVVFLGDAVHTAHFSVGSGTKMAMEDAAFLAQAMVEYLDYTVALEHYQARRRPLVARIQDSSLPSLSWWDHFGEYHRVLAPWQFGFHFFSRAISAGKIQLRDPKFVADADDHWRREHDGHDPLNTPVPFGGVIFRTRLLALVAGTGGLPELTDGTSIVDFGTGSRSGVQEFTAPDVDTTVLSTALLAALDDVCSRAGAGLVVRGGTPLSRVLCAEHARFVHALTVVLVDDTGSVRARRAVDERDSARTLILAGRADAVVVCDGTTSNSEHSVLATAEVAP